MNSIARKSQDHLRFHGYDASVVEREGWPQFEPHDNKNYTGRSLLPVSALVAVISMCIWLNLFSVLSCCDMGSLQQHGRRFWHFLWIHQYTRVGWQMVMATVMRMAFQQKVIHHIPIWWGWWCGQQLRQGAKRLLGPPPPPKWETRPPALPCFRLQPHDQPHPRIVPTL